MALTELQWIIFAVAVCGCITLYFVIRKCVSHYTHLYHQGKSTIFFRGFTKYSKANEYQLMEPLMIQCDKDKSSLRTCERGDIIHRDFRDENDMKSNKQNVIRIVSLNMEMGKQLDKVISDLRDLDCDIICLQEVDCGTKRCHFVDCVAAIGKQLKLNSLFSIEVINPGLFRGKEAKKLKKCEKSKNINETDYKLDSSFFGGYQGNAILTKHDIIDYEGLVIDCGRLNDTSHSRFKTHNETFAIIQINNNINIGTYSLHFDPHNAGVDGRIGQYFEVLKHACKCKNENLIDALILCGDFNTAANGIARLHPTLSSDWKTRIGTFGKTESEYFDKHGVTQGNKIYGLDLSDPFDKVNDITFYFQKGLYQSKLDWCLLSDNLSVINKLIAPVNDRCSDHQWIMVEATLPN